MKDLTIWKFETCSRINNLEENSFYIYKQQKVQNV